MDPARPNFFAGSYLERRAEAREDPQWLAADTVEIVIQINGKLRSRMKLAAGTANDVLEKEALMDPKVQAALSGKSVGKVIIVPDKLVNIVAK